MSSVAHPPYLSRQGLSIKPRACRSDMGSLASQLALGKPRLFLLRLELQAGGHTHMAWVPGIGTQALLPLWQAF